MRLLLLLLLLNCGSEKLFKPPLDRGTITSSMGGRWGRLHFGVDIASPKNTPIYTIADGTVVNVSKDRIYGNRVDVYHADTGLYSSYSHMNRVDVSVDDRVRSGDLLGLVGTTGKSTGYHLHFEIYNANGAYINPLQLITHNYGKK